VTYLYCQNPPTVNFAIPSRKDREVTDPKRIVFTAHWTLPIASFAFNEATLSRKDVPAGNGRERCLSLRARGGDFFGPPFIRFICDLPAAGKYKVYIDVVKGSEQGIVQLSVAESPIGEPLDLFVEKPARANGIYAGEMTAVEGNNNVMFKLVGKNAAASNLGLDLIDVVFVKAP